MEKLEELNVLVVTHLAYYRKTSNPVPGPFSSVLESLQKIGLAKIGLLGLPLKGFEGPIIYQIDQKKYHFQIPKFLGVVSLFKYGLDLVLSFCLTLNFLILQKREIKKSVVIAHDALVCLPLIFLRILLPFKLVFYCLDFSKNRSSNYLMQKLYEWADRVSSLKSDQTWAVCQSLISYKKDHYGADSLLISNSFPFDGSSYHRNKDKRNGRRVVWTGSILTDKQIDHLFRLCRAIRNLRPEMEFWFVPANRIADFHEAVKSFRMEEPSRIFEVMGQAASRELVSQCDLGLAVYDRDYGSTHFIEPIKIWEYLMCGLPFIISGEPSVNNTVKEAGVAFFLDPDNEVPADDSLQNFIEPKNLRNLTTRSVQLARQFDATETIRKAFGNL